MTVDIDALEKLAKAATPATSPPALIPEGEENRWWIEGEEFVEGFEGTVARCERFELTDYIAAANPAAVLELLSRLRAADNIVRDLAAKPAPRTVTMLGPTCGLCGGMLHGMVNQKPDMHSIDCPYRRAVELQRQEAKR